MAQGKVGDGRGLQGMVVEAWVSYFFILVAGYMWVWVVPGFLGKWGEREVEREKEI
jgi:hypothetical protein